MSLAPFEQVELTQRRLLTPPTDPLHIATKDYVDHHGGGGTLNVNGTPIPPDPDTGEVAIEFVGNCFVHPDAANYRVQVEYLDQLDGSSTDPDDPVGWGNWPVGDLRFLPGLSVAPPGCAICDGSYYRASTYPAATSSPHVTMTEDKLNNSYASTTEQGTLSDDGKWWGKAGDTCEYWHTYQDASAVVSYRSWRLAWGAAYTYYLSVNYRPVIAPTGNQNWLDTEFAVRFPEPTLFTGYTLGANTEYSVTTYGIAGLKNPNDPATRQLCMGVDSWDVYGITNPNFDPTDKQQGDLVLVEEVTNRYALTAWTDIWHVPAGTYYGVLFRIKKRCVSSAAGWDPEVDPWPETAAANADVRIVHVQLYKSDVFRVPILPTVENGVTGIWCIRLAAAP